MVVRGQSASPENAPELTWSIFNTESRHYPFVRSLPGSHASLASWGTHKATFGILASAALHVSPLMCNNRHLVPEDAGELATMLAI